MCHIFVFIFVGRRHGRSLLNLGLLVAASRQQAYMKRAHFADPRRISGARYHNVTTWGHALTSTLSCWHPLNKENELPQKGQCLRTCDVLGVLQKHVIITTGCASETTFERARLQICWNTFEIVHLWDIGNYFGINKVPTLIVYFNFDLLLNFCHPNPSNPNLDRIRIKKLLSENVTKSIK